MSAAETLPQESQAEVPPNPFSGKQPEVDLVVDVTPEPERSEDPNHPKRKPSAEEEQVPDPHKRPKRSEDFQESAIKSPEDQEPQASSVEQRELQMTACKQVVDQVQALKEEAKWYFSQKEYTKALSKYEDAISAFQKVLVPREYLQVCQDLRAQLLNNIALCCFKVQDFALALKVAEQGVKEFPQDLKLIYSYATALCYQGEYDRALSHMKRLNRAHPDNEQFLTKIKEIQKEKEDHNSKLKEMYGGKLLPSPPKEAPPENESSSFYTWGLIAAFAGLTIGGIYFARKYFSTKH